MSPALARRVLDQQQRDETALCFPSLKGPRAYESTISPSLTGRSSSTSGGPAR
jgi:hypothetical protein